MMLIKYLALLGVTFISFSITACEERQNGSYVTPGTTSAHNESRRLDYEIYAAYLKSLALPEAKKILICLETVNEDAGESFGDAVRNRFRSNELEDTLIKSFIDVNNAPQTLERHFNLAQSYELIPNSELREISAGKSLIEAEQAFQKRFPDSSWPQALSVVGYNESRTRALFYVIRWGADARYVVMRNDHGRWVVDIERLAYIV